MEARNLDAFIIACDEPFSAARHYLTSGAQMTTGLIMKKRGDAPVIFANPMETEEAAKSGLKVYSFNDLDWPGLVKQFDGDRTKAEVVFWGKCLELLGVPSGRIGIYGVSDLNLIVELVRLLEAAYSQYEWAGEMGMTLFDEAYTTKDAAEVATIRSVANRTSAVLQATWDFISRHRVEGDGLVKSDGSPLTIGDVRRFVRRTLLDHDLEDTSMIFAQGRDAGFPHSRGEDTMGLRLGQSIVFDLFPREVGGGYFHDTTRTWCIGYAPDEVQQAYDQVMEALDIAVEVFRPGIPAKQLQEAVQDYFENKGHATSRSNPGATDGYVHSLGHGVGLNIHERPSMGHLTKDVLQPGNVIAIEPGLYYPERGFGVRVEDTFYVDDAGNLVSLTSFRKDLVMPMA
jgi:Xaa-Pro aminopeptidase